VDRGIDVGRVVRLGCGAIPPRPGQAAHAVLRLASAEEIARLEEVRGEDTRALELFREEVARSGLPMRCVDAERQFDGNRITFYFMAEGRVDFRELVRDLARVFRTRIELRQISARESARRQEGLGPCGRPLCCASFLQWIEAVRVREARMQVPSQTTQRVTGICGRLLCCLAYEENGDAVEGGTS
jgi:cell fate regulator YaaT (PSP1 superfamily)